MASQQLWWDDDKEDTYRTFPRGGRIYRVYSSYPYASVCFAEDQVPPDDQPRSLPPVQGQRSHAIGSMSSRPGDYGTYLGSDVDTLSSGLARVNINYAAAETPLVNYLQGHPPYTYPIASGSQTFPTHAHQHGTYGQTPLSPSVYETQQFHEPSLHPNWSQVQAPTIHTGPPEKVTDPTLLEHGVHAWKRVSGSGGRREKFDPAYEKQNRGFFQLGKVFTVLWAEPTNSNATNDTIITSKRWPDERFFTKIRWFVVVRQSHDSCSCLPISTYGGKGTTGGHKRPEQHAIAYTNDTIPQRLHGEETLLPNAILVTGSSPIDVLDPVSRVNFHKIYTVEHNVKVKDFGIVEGVYLSWLMHYFEKAMSLSWSPLRQPAPNSRSSERASTLQTQDLEVAGMRVYAGAHMPSTLASVEQDLTYQHLNMSGAFESQTSEDFANNLDQLIQDHESAPQE